MKKSILICLILFVVLVCGCMQTNNTNISMQKTQNTSEQINPNPTHNLTEYLSMKNPSSFSFNYTSETTIPSLANHLQEIVFKDEYHYYKNSDMEAYTDSSFNNFYTLQNGSTYGCQRVVGEENTTYCKIGLNEYSWNNTIPRDVFKKYLFSNLENYTSQSYVSTKNIIGRNADCFSYNTENLSSFEAICFDTQTGVVMSFHFEYEIEGNKYSTSYTATGLDLNEPPSDVFVLPQSNE